MLSTRGKTRITIYLDDDVIERFKTLSERTGKGYQTLINEALASQAEDTTKVVTVAQVRNIVREELAARS